MAKQPHKKFSDVQIKELIVRYLEGKIKREHIKIVLVHEINAYNYKRVHSTTGEVSYFKFQRAMLHFLGSLVLLPHISLPRIYLP